MGLPGGLAVKNPPANTGDTGLIPGLGRSHMLQSSCAHTPHLLSPYWAHEPQLLKPEHPRAHALQQETLPQWESPALPWRVAPTHHNLLKFTCSNEDPVMPKINKLRNKYFFKNCCEGRGQSGGYSMRRGRLQGLEKCKKAPGTLKTSSILSKGPRAHLEEAPTYQKWDVWTWIIKTTAADRNTWSI